MTVIKLNDDGYPRRKSFPNWLIIAHVAMILTVCGALVLIRLTGV